MKLPRWLMGGALVFWGWQTGLWPWALIMAAALEASNLTPARWEMADTDLNRICDLCLVLFVAAGMLLYSTEDRLVVIFKFAQWMPFCFFPVALAQSYGDRPAIPLSAFSWLLRRVPQSPLSRTSFNISYGYFVICLIGASASTQANEYFYAGVSVLILLALASVRPNRVSWPKWIILSAIVLMCGRFSHQGLKQLQDRMERALGGLLADFFHSTTDPRECPTSIGKAGPISLSGRIVLRVRVPQGDISPGLLREGAYDSYRMQTWTASSNDLAYASITSNGLVRLLPPKKLFSSVEISGFFPGGEGLVPIPHGTFQIEDFPGTLKTNRLGVAKVLDGPGLLNIHADYWTGQSIDGPPDPMDLGVSEDEKPALRAVVTELGLNKMDDERQKIRAINRFFQDPRNHFRYSLILPGRPRRSEQKNASSTFSADEIHDLPELVDRLTTQSDPISDFLWRKFSDTEQEKIRAFQPSAQNSNQLQGIIVQHLNELIQGPSIYGRQRFQGVLLRPETTKFMHEGPTGPNLAFLNRLLLEDAYPVELSRNQKTPLGRFLLENRIGHCEYFATATVLLLREAGVNARYITGFAVTESARHGDTYLIRERHRHAWALAYHSDTKTWEQIDNTPSSWAEAADASPSWSEPAKDFLSNLYYQFSKWRWGKGSISRYSQWALVPLIIYLLWRILSTRRRQRNGDGASSGLLEPPWPGMDSELFLINHRLAAMQLSRLPHEPLSRWQQRLEEAFPASQTLPEIFQMHRRLRFDPRGLPNHDRETLRRQAGEWLAEFPAQLEQPRQPGQG